MIIIYTTSFNLAAYIITLTWDDTKGMDIDRLMGLSLRIFCFDTVFSSVLMHSCFVFFLALSCALCSYATAVFLCWLLLSVFTFGVRWHFWGFRLSSIQPLEFGYTLHRGASTTPRLIDSSCWASSIMVRACAFQRGFVHLGLSLGSCSRVLPGGVKCARPAILLLSSSAVKACLFPFLSSFDLIYTNSFFFGLGSSDERAYSWHKQQLTLFWSGRFVADIGNIKIAVHKVFTFSTVSSCCRRVSSSSTLTRTRASRLLGMATFPVHIRMATRKSIVTAALDLR